jgi:hypothetical protein
MKEIDVALKAVVEGLKMLAQGVEKIAEKLEDSVPNKQPTAKPARKAATKPKKTANKKTISKKAPLKKAVKVTAADTVLAIIKRSKKGIDSASLVKKTGFDKKKIANIVFKLRKQGKIKSVSKGVYTKV